uniref:Zinc finger, AN1-type domain 4 n=1 Tax=Astyanax mexicanus TaxID=7994 RepID=A0A3B1ISW7_ASTMX
MADKREPPFFNDDNFGLVHYKLPFYETMELFIETLTGTCFQLRVSPFETIISVKAKIQRLEGIPVAQQHLIWNSLELEDEYCLHDYSIAEGCTLKLVLAMRGGPINTRRVTVEDSVKETSDCLDKRSDELWEKSLSNKQVTFLVYREGDQLNFFRVVDRGDGTLTPVSESLSGGSMRNMYAEEEEDGVSSSSAQLTLENSITMNKMKLLKSKMENMNLNKKPKKTAKLKVRPPAGPRPFSSSLGTVRHHRMFRVLPQIGHASATTHLPPVGDQQQPATPSSAAGPYSTPLAPHRSPTSGRAIPSLAASSTYVLQEEEPWKNPTPRKIRLPPKVSRLDVGGSKVIRDCVHPPFSVLSAQHEADPQSDRITLVEDAVVMEPPKPVSFNSLLPEPLSLDVSTQRDASLDSLGAVAESMAAPTLLSQAVGSDSISTWPIGTKTLQSQSDSDTWAIGTKTLQSQPVLNLPSEPLTPPRMPQPFEFTGASLRASPSHTLLRSLDSPPVPPRSPPQAAALCGIKVSSPGKRTEVMSKSEARDITKMANKASKELLGCVSNTELLASLAGTGGRECMAGTRTLGRLCGASAPLPANIHLLQEDLLRRINPLQRAVVYTPSGMLGSSSGSSSSIKRQGTPTYHLPPVKAPVGSKKKTSKHCFLCGKKTGLATSYECRCGNNFCSTHRYAETHDCTYDYKNAGRRFLQESNPIISAPKLPKI